LSDEKEENEMVYIAAEERATIISLEDG